MRVVKFATLRKFFEVHEDSESALRQWNREATAANWASPYQIKAAYPSASVLGNNRVCFNVKGNKYRLIVAVDYANGFVLVKFIGTHADYDKIDADTVGGGAGTRK